MGVLGYRRLSVQIAIRNPQSAISLHFMAVQVIAWAPTHAGRILDQRLLPETTQYRDLNDAQAVGEAIRTLQVRGAPLIGIAAAMGVVADLRVARGASREAFLERLAAVSEQLGATRPTAVNLRWALRRMVDT